MTKKMKKRAPKKSAKKSAPKKTIIKSSSTTSNVKTLLWTACYIFGIIGAIHLSRLFLRFSVIFVVSIPLWVNFVIGLLALWLSWMFGMAAKED